MNAANVCSPDLGIILCSGRRLITIDDLARRCGFFCSTEDNNGYGCYHQHANEGLCLRRSCPIAYPASYNDMVELDPDLAEEYAYQVKEGKDEDESLDSDWMVQHRSYLAATRL